MSSMTSSILNYTTFAINILIACGGIVLAGFGAVFVTITNKGVDVFGDDFSFGALAISVGGIAFVFGIFGGAAVFLKNRILLTISGFLLSLVFIIQLSLGVMALTKIRNEDDFSNYVQDLLQDLGDEDMDEFQKEFDCCEYKNGVQSSSCKFPSADDCLSAFISAIKYPIKTVGHVGIVFSIFEVIDTILVFLIRKVNTRFV